MIRVSKIPFPVFSPRFARCKPVSIPQVARDRSSHDNAKWNPHIYFASVLFFEMGARSALAPQGSRVGGEEYEYREHLAELRFSTFGVSPGS